MSKIFWVTTKCWLIRSLQIVKPNSLHHRILSVIVTPSTASDCCDITDPLKMFSYCNKSLVLYGTIDEYVWVQDFRDVTLYCLVSASWCFEDHSARKVKAVQFFAMSRNTHHKGLSHPTTLQPIATPLSQPHTAQACVRKWLKNNFMYSPGIFL
jgi:hypothetical protein